MYLLTMGAFKLFALLSLIAFASAERLTIVNNCQGDFEYSTISFTQPSDFSCEPMDTIPGGNDDSHELDYSYDSQYLIIKRSVSGADVTGANFDYAGSLGDLLADNDAGADYGSKCLDIHMSESDDVFQLFDPTSSYLSLCDPLISTTDLDDTPYLDDTFGGVNAPAPAPEPEPIHVYRRLPSHLPVGNRSLPNYGNRRLMSYGSITRNIPSYGNRRLMSYGSNMRNIPRYGSTIRQP